MHADLHAAAMACHPRPQHCRKLEQFAQTRVLVATVLKPRRSTVANPDRDTVYTNDGTNRTVYTRENNSTGWFVGIIVALALLAIAYLVFSANSQPSTSSVDINNTPAVTAPAAPAELRHARRGGRLCRARGHSVPCRRAAGPPRAAQGIRRQFPLRPHRQLDALTGISRPERPSGTTP